MATTLVVALLALNVAAPLGSCSKSGTFSLAGIGKRKKEKKRVLMLSFFFSFEQVKSVNEATACSVLCS